MKRLCLTTVLILAMSNMLFAKYHIRHPHPHYHTETRPSDDNQDDNHIALLILSRWTECWRIFAIPQKKDKQLLKIMISLY